MYETTSGSRLKVIKVTARRPLARAPERAGKKERNELLPCLHRALLLWQFPSQRRVSFASCPLSRVLSS